MGSRGFTDDTVNPMDLLPFPWTIFQGTQAEGHQDRVSLNLDCSFYPEPEFSSVEDGSNDHRQSTYNRALSAASNPSTQFGAFHLVAGNGHFAPPSALTSALTQCSPSTHSFSLQYHDLNQQDPHYEVNRHHLYHEYEDIRLSNSHPGPNVPPYLPAFNGDPLPSALGLDQTHPQGGFPITSHDEPFFISPGMQQHQASVYSLSFPHSGFTYPAQCDKVSCSTKDHGRTTIDRSLSRERDEQQSISPHQCQVEIPSVPVSQSYLSDVLAEDSSSAPKSEGVDAVAPKNLHIWRCGICNDTSAKQFEKAVTECHSSSHLDMGRTHFHIECLRKDDRPHEQDIDWHCPDCRYTPSSKSARASRTARTSAKTSKRAVHQISRDVPASEPNRDENPNLKKRRKLTTEWIAGSQNLAISPMLNGSNMKKKGKKASAWSAEENAFCIKIMKEIKASGICERVDQLWGRVSQKMYENGMYRSPGGVKNAWNRWLRYQSKFDERARPRPDALKTGLLKSQRDRLEISQDNVDPGTMSASSAISGFIEGTNRRREQKRESKDTDDEPDADGSPDPDFAF